MYSLYEVREPDPPYYGIPPENSETSLRQRLARNIRLLRTARRWSQEALAQKAGLDRTYVGAVERAERNLTLASIEKLAEALGVEVRELFF